jgi:hypothetical protein
MMAIGLAALSAPRQPKNNCDLDKIRDAALLPPRAAPTMRCGHRPPPTAHGEFRGFYSQQQKGRREAGLFRVLCGVDQ